MNDEDRSKGIDDFCEAADRLELVGRLRGWSVYWRANGAPANAITTDAAIQQIERDGMRIESLERRISQAEAERDALDSSHKAIGKQLAEMGAERVRSQTIALDRMTSALMAAHDVPDDACGDPEVIAAAMNEAQRIIDALGQ